MTWERAGFHVINFYIGRYISVLLCWRCWSMSRNDDSWNQLGKMPPTEAMRLFVRTLEVRIQKAVLRKLFYFSSRIGYCYIVADCIHHFELCGLFWTSRIVYWIWTALGTQGELMSIVRSAILSRGAQKLLLEVWCRILVLSSVLHFRLGLSWQPWRRVMFAVWALTTSNSICRGITFDYHIQGCQ